MTGAHGALALLVYPPPYSWSARRLVRASGDNLANNQPRLIVEPRRVPIGTSARSARTILATISVTAGSKGA